MNRTLLSFVAMGLVGSAAGTAIAQPYVINIYGATLQRSFFDADASTNDAIDVDGDGVVRENLAPTDSLEPYDITIPGNEQFNHWWSVSYSGVGSGNGLAGLVNWGQLCIATGADGVEINSNRAADNAQLNREVYVQAGIPVGFFNSGNPNASPIRSFKANPADISSGANPGVADGNLSGADFFEFLTRFGAGDLSVDFTSPANPGTPDGILTGADFFAFLNFFQNGAPNAWEATSSVQVPQLTCWNIDIAPTDVPFVLFVTDTTNDGFPVQTPQAPGYGNNPRVATAKDGSPVSQGNKLRSLTPNSALAQARGAVTLNLNVNNPDQNTIFDNVPFAVAVAHMVNYGAGYSQMTAAELRHGYATGRLPNGENLTFITRDSGSGTRNAGMNGICLDPSYGVGENIGLGKANNGIENIVGPNYEPSNWRGSTELRNAVVNTRLGIGTNGAERAVSRGWVFDGRADVLAVQNDGGVGYYRPTQANVLQNSTPESYRVVTPSSLATIGDPKASPSASASGPLNNNPRMDNPHAADYMNNLTRSIDDFVAGTPATFTPGEFLAETFVLAAALDAVPTLTDPCNWQPNTGLNATLQASLLANPSQLLNQLPTTFDTNRSGRVPARTAGIDYTDRPATGGNVYVAIDGVTTFTQGANLPNGGASRNRLVGDGNGDGVRDINDAASLVRLYEVRAGLQPLAAWIDPNPVAGEPACPELLMDGNNDGNYDLEDLRYWADGLALVGGNLDRRAGFTELDNAFAGNLFGTVLITGKTYAAGDSRGDIAGNGTTRGYAPVGHDFVVDALDIDYVYSQFKFERNALVTDGEATWADITEAASFDLSADMNGDLVVDQADICELITVILGTTIGDVDLNGTADASDRATIVANQGLSPAGFGDGDINGDNVVDQGDLDVFDGVTVICP